MTRTIISIALFVLVAASAEASGRGDQLLWQCNGTASSEAQLLVGKATCAGYVSGFLDAYQVAINVHDAKPAFCLPPTGISNDQAIRIVVKYLEAHPEDLHETARSSVFLALRAAFPCKTPR